MSNFVSVARDNDVAIVTIDNPPVNALSFHVREPLMHALAALRDDASVGAIVVACAGRTFVAGADITEFGKPVQQPELRAIIGTLETIAKPTVAAIHGTALGGGLELALGCHFRVADADARLGLPEVKLGLLPGGGGTVRLPRLVGAIKALRMIVSGALVGADEAHEAGLVDAVFESNVITHAVNFAREIARKGGPFTPVRDRDDEIKKTELAAFDAEAADLARKARGLDAPIACAQAVRNTVTMSFEEALAAERALFMKLVASDQSRAQRHLFFAEREAAKVPGKDLVRRRIARVGVVGAGTMGGGIAMAFVNGGFPVTLLETSQEALQRGLGMIDKNYAVSVSRGSLTEDAKRQRLAQFKGSTDYSDLADCDLIIEAVFEDMAVKKEVFGKLDAMAKPGAILATNTSYLDIDEIAASISRPQDVLGLHFFSPANVMKLLEIVRADKTAPDALATVVDLARRIGKVAVVVGVCHGFVGNRMLAARGSESEALLLEGATPSQIDKAFTDFGWPMGPFQMSDLAGLDISWRNRKARGQTAVIADTLCEQGRFGQKTGRGYYLYENGSRMPVPDPQIDALIRGKAAEKGIASREISAEEIIERTLYPMVNEGAKILEEGIAARASDIDVIWVNGYGFPIGKGGPMFWAGLEGAPRIVERLEYWHQRTGKDVFKPARLLKRMAETGSWEAGARP
ncbi:MULTISPECIES: 3-hydroxyacyl-CoA dehydrogenase NAD-binding domain-containing protein [unclassified Mesorhizobium]|uniref:3-hydroxyacyl-CoA dehydrogenase NAD-binding domain-containing protein n=1 Tax=unclassified Mesorhizobium TaxID=325217 RepID=UPI001128AD6A|nr:MULTISPECIES: 3-hydroxyacyl-CoA dehydrogenase NAD-binding domain-containing protein [unclassified Mesorhizobium]TPK55485.1 3-hydroxyacyl-CoA dehydrogenase [Mesorhizobium sp. B2-5-2]TPL28051.1 3-hydroxyacyl-CoA dehydrogenase [Mesorhizobium sp. B2-4-7]TPL31398.1 3-hydroxyacyl-CoA dehydrogenase [Mesorhizobium sp. B2-4-9]TPL41521.1 3-hydroxyacyl-CoA dehydrogenase [Mesorhizobium sp. B2-4-5]TPM78030.1 3-hydroxyacyl-CoA dehydrogenase [Mesorhizobium sp. B2-1-6]